MSTLREVGESQARLYKLHREPQGVLGCGKFAVTYTVKDEQGCTRSFARANLHELGFTTPPLWSEVMRRVRGLGRYCRPADAEKLQAQLNELADVFRPVIRPHNGQIAVCHGGGILMHPVQAPFHRLMLDTEVVFEKAT